jgi:pilus assembly protein CpaF
VTAPALLDRVRARLALETGPPTRAGVAAVVREEAGGLLGDDDVLLAVRNAVDELAGAGPLEPLLRTPGVTDVLVNGPEHVWVDRGTGLELTEVRFPDDDAVRRLAVRLAATAGRRLDDAAPWVDAGLPDGTRLHAVLAPVSGSGTCLSLRVLRRCALSLDELAALGTLPGESGQLLRALVARRLAFLVTGGTGSGKTTLLSALLGDSDPGDRLVLCEDAAELTPAHPHVVRLLTRPPNVEGVGQVTVRDLVRQALRMRPDRLVVGEVREAEALDLLIALNSGLPGMCSIHANTAGDALAKLCTLPLLAGRNIDSAFVIPTVASAIDIVVHCELLRTGRRRITEIIAPSGHVSAGVIETSAIFGLRHDVLEPTGTAPARTVKFRSAGFDPAQLLGGGV